VARPAQGRSGGGLVAGPGDRSVNYLERTALGRAGSLSCAVDRTGRFLLVANYNSGSVAVLPIAEDGRLQPASSVVQHEGSSVNPGRQKGPHAHCVVLDAANRHLLAADLGIDRVMVYRFDDKAGKLSSGDPPLPRVCLAPAHGI